MNESTHLICDWNCGILMFYEEIEKINSDVKGILDSLAEHMVTSVEDLKQYESIIVNFPIERVWKIVSNWKIFHKLVPCISEEIEFRGNPEGVGGIIIHIMINEIFNLFLVT